VLPDPFQAKRIGSDSHARTSSNNSGTVDEYGNVANPTRCTENRCSNQCRLVNLSQKGRANGSHRLQSTGNTQIVRPAGSPRIPHVDGCDRIPCSPDRQFSSGAAATLTSVSLITVMLAAGMGVELISGRRQNSCRVT